MSRGSGWLQNRILQAANAAEPITLDCLCWEIASMQGLPAERRRATGLSPAGIRKTFYSSFRRAARRLKVSGQITIRKQKIETFDEFVKWYPHQTRSIELRGLRSRLLPHIAQFLTKTGARFSFAERERFLADAMPLGSTETWETLEDRIILRVSDASPSDRELLLQLIAKGRQYFCSSGISCRHSLGELIMRVKPVLAPTEWERIQQFYVQCFPKQSRNHVAFKSTLYQVVRLARGTKHPWLDDEVKGHLLEVEKEIIEALPGHKTLEPGDGFDGFIVLQGHTFSPVLDRLISRDVFRALEYVEPAIHRA
jgi:hypothetical protein